MTNCVPKPYCAGAATKCPPSKLIGFPLAVRPLAFLPQHLGHGQYAVTFIRTMCDLADAGFASCISSVEFDVRSVAIALSVACSSTNDVFGSRPAIALVAIAPSTPRPITEHAAISTRRALRCV